jgi:hypothetical protein
MFHQTFIFRRKLFYGQILGIFSAWCKSQKVVSELKSPKVVSQVSVRPIHSLMTRGGVSNGYFERARR